MVCPGHKAQLVCAAPQERVLQVQPGQRVRSDKQARVALQGHVDRRALRVLTAPLVRKALRDRLVLDPPDRQAQAGPQALLVRKARADHSARAVSPARLARAARGVYVD